MDVRIVTLLLTVFHIILLIVLVYNVVTDSLLMVSNVSVIFLIVQVLIQLLVLAVLVKLVINYNQTNVLVFVILMINHLIDVHNGLLQLLDKSMPFLILGVLQFALIVNHQTLFVMVQTDIANAKIDYDEIKK